MNERRLPTMTNVPALRRGLAILRFLAEHGEPASAPIIAAKLELPRSTVFHLLVELRRARFVKHLPKERAYTIGEDLFSLLNTPVPPQDRPDRGQIET